jgi:DNA-binding GntR family transcriptional regulator
VDPTASPSESPKTHLGATARIGKSLADDVYEILKWKVLTLGLTPGSLFREEDLCKLVGYGRSPVHEALHRLKYDGLVDILPRKGILVRPFSPDRINDLIEARLPIEVEMARLAAQRASALQIRSLKAKLQRGGQLLSKGDREGLMTLDRQFHRGMADCSGNSVIIDVLENLHQRSLMLWHIAVSSDGREYGTVQTEHEQIMEAIAAHDEEAAALAMRDHLRRFLRR